MCSVTCELPEVSKQHSGMNIISTVILLILLSGYGSADRDTTKQVLFFSPLKHVLFLLTPLISVC